MTDHYVVLGIPPQATADEIKHAFRKLAFQYHPDRNSNHDAEERFKEISRAYEILSDPEKRRAYDSAMRPPAPTPELVSSIVNAICSILSDPNTVSAIGDLIITLTRPKNPTKPKYPFEKGDWGI